jgi:hypothetical protein
VGSARPGAGWAYACVAIQFVCQLALLVQQLAPLRVFFRSAAIGTSLAFLLLVPGWGRRGQAAHALGMAVIAIITLSAFNPQGGAPGAVVAHWAFYVAVLGPLFWVSRLELNERTLGGLLLCLWAFHFVSSITGVLQVMFPGRFQPALASFITERQVANIRLASGEWVPRPMGLSDTPGGAGAAGFYATLIGLGVVMLKPFPFARVLGIASMITGMICVYLSQVRAGVVLIGVCFTVLVVLLMLSSKISGFVGALMIGIGVVFVSFELAFAVGGDMMVARLQTLVDSPPITVYQTNRGAMLEGAILSSLPEYPLGAGLARWGMMNAYFGSSEHEIGAELQWVGWILDGGVPLTLVYLAAMLSALWVAVREGIWAEDPRRRGWASIVAAYDVGMLALCFSYAPFMSAAGVQFWLLNAVVLSTCKMKVPRANPALLGRATR